MTGPTYQRATRQRDAVVDALARATGFRAAQELHEDLRAEGTSVGLTTVYRQLQSLTDAGSVDVLRSTDGEARYRACPTDEHHHHLVCRTCGRSVEVAGPAVEAWAAATASEHGFTDVTHSVEIFGTCSYCRS